MRIRTPAEIQMRVLLQRRCLLRCVAIGLVLVAEWLSVQVPTVDAEVFRESAFERERTRTWRYGYILEHHGAVLVKTPLGTGAPTPAPVDTDDGVAREMARTLRLLPWKAAFELSFYALLWALWSAGVARWRRRCSSEMFSRWRRSAALGLSWAILITVVLAPYLVAGYGEPLFSTWRGPGALSYTTWFGSTGGPWDPSLTYRNLVLSVLMLPLVSMEWTLGFLAPLGVPAAFWVISVVFYGLGAAAWAWTFE